jgi:hypothetical protein
VTTELAGIFHVAVDLEVFQSSKYGSMNTNETEDHTRNFPSIFSFSPFSYRVKSKSPLSEHYFVTENIRVLVG